MPELKVGNLRDFSFSNKKYKIREILENPQISLLWTWDSGVCPHCKNKITRNIKHDFYKIEILGENDIDDDKLTIDNIYLLGFTLDKRTMLIPKDKYNEVFQKSKKFKRL